jgi:hypothetical protein
VPSTKIQSVLERRKQAAKQAKRGTVPVNKAAVVEPPVERRKVKSLSRKPVVDDVIEAEEILDDDGDSPAPVQSKSTGKVSSRAEARKAVRALTRTEKPQAGPLALPLMDKSRELNQNDMVWPRLHISQAMSKVNTEDIVRQGNFYRSPSNTNLGTSILVIPCDMRKSRSYWESGQGVLCRSYDMVQGEGDPGILCEGTPEEIAEGIPAHERGCPLRLWGERDANGRSTKPDCGENYNYPMLILDPDDPADGKSTQAIYSFRGKAIKVARQLNTIIMENGGVWTDTILEMSVQKESNALGTYYVPAVEYHAEAAGNSHTRARNIARNLTGAVVRRSVEAEADED